MKILLFIPVFRCQSQIGRVIRQITPKIQRLITEVLVIDNQSPDRTVYFAKKALKRLKKTHSTLLRNNQNYGLGGSHKIAFTYAKAHGFSHILVLHGDDQAQLSEFVPYLEKFPRRVDCVLGARFSKSAQLKNYSLVRLWGNQLANYFFSLLARTRIDDLGAGLNLYRSSALDQKTYMRLPDDLTFNVYLLLWSIYRHQTIVFSPISWRSEDQISNVKLLPQTLKILRLFGSYFWSPTRTFTQLPKSSRRHYDYQVLIKSPWMKYSS